VVFKYKGFSPDGKKIKGTIESPDIESAKKNLKSKNIFYIDISEQQEFPFAKIFSIFKRKNKISPEQLAMLSRDLSIYLKSGIPIVQALRLARNQYKDNKRIHAFLSIVVNLVDEGKSFYGALEAQSILDLPDFYKQSIKVSENSGILQEVLLELANFLKEQSRINKQIQSAFAYPMFIVVVSLFMVAFMITFVVPKITGIFTQLGQKLPKITIFVIATGEFFQNYWYILFIIIMIIVLMHIILLKTQKKYKYAIDLIMLKIPYFGKMIETSELARFSYISSVLIRSGVPFVQVVKLSSGILKNSVLRDLFVNASERVVEGGRLSSALNSADYKINSTFVQAIALGEETSQVANILSNLSEMFFEENKDKTALLLSMLEPALMLLVGGIIGLIVTAMLLPIFSMNIGGNL